MFVRHDKDRCGAVNVGVQSIGWKRDKLKRGCEALTRPTLKLQSDVRLEVLTSLEKHKTIHCSTLK